MPRIDKGRMLIAHMVVANMMGGTKIIKQAQQATRACVSVDQSSAKQCRLVGRQSLALQVALPSREPVWAGGRGGLRGARRYHGPWSNNTVQPLDRATCDQHMPGHVTLQGPSCHTMSQQVLNKQVVDLGFFIHCISQQQEEVTKYEFLRVEGAQGSRLP